VLLAEAGHFLGVVVESAVRRVPARQVRQRGGGRNGGRREQRSTKDCGDAREHGGGADVQCHRVAPLHRIRAATLEEYHRCPTGVTAVRRLPAPPFLTQ